MLENLFETNRSRRLQVMTLSVPNSRAGYPSHFRKVQYDTDISRVVNHPAESGRLQRRMTATDPADILP